MDGDRILLPYVETENQVMVYSQEDHREFTELYDLMDHANKKIINLTRENKDISAKLAFKCTAEWDNGYKKAHEHYIKEMITLKEVNKKLHDYIKKGCYCHLDVTCKVCQDLEEMSPKQ